MRRLWLIPIAFVALAVPAAVLAGGGEGGFDGVVHSIESRYHVAGDAYSLSRPHQLCVAQGYAWRGGRDPRGRV